MSLWPDLPATLFASDARFPHANAHVEWVLNRQDVEGYKEGYRRAAMHLAQTVIRNDDSCEFLVWPIAWLWRHHLELALKDIVAVGPMLERDSAEWVWPTQHGHRLRRLWDAALPFILPHGDPEAESLANAGAIVAEFDALDPDGTGFRYPFDRDGGRNLVLAPTHINVGLLDETMQRLSNFLSAVRDCQQSALNYLAGIVADQRAEYEAEMRAAYEQDLSER